MANVQHAALTTTDLHEPKGVAGASAFKVYVADGDGSGAWTISPHGWGMYADSKTGASDQVVTNSAAKLQNDGAGAATVITKLPPAIRGSGTLWDTTNDKFTPMQLHDAYVITLQAVVTSEASSPTELTVQFDIGGTGSVSNVVLERYIELGGRAVPYNINVTGGLYVTATMLTNGVTIYVKTDTGTVDINDFEILINRTHGGTDW